MEDLVKEIYQGKYSLSKEDFDRNESRLKKIEFSDFIVYVHRDLPSLKAEEMMLGTFLQWKGFGLIKWKNIVNRLQSEELGLISLVGFIGRYLNIDLRIYMDSIEQVTREKVYSYVTDSSPLFYYDSKYRDPLLAKFGLKYDDFSHAKSRLLAEGAKEIVPKRPDNIKIW